MSIDNLGKKHITPVQIADFDAAMNILLNITRDITQKLSNEDRRKFSRIQERNKLFTNATQAWSQSQSYLKSPDVDWDEFEADYNDRKFADTRDDMLDSVKRMLTDFKIVHDYDNYQDALIDYRYTKYKASANEVGYGEKVNYFGQFFKKTKRKKKEENNEPLS